MERGILTIFYCKSRLKVSLVLYITHRGSGRERKKEQSKEGQKEGGVKGMCKRGRNSTRAETLLKYPDSKWKFPSHFPEFTPNVIKKENNTIIFTILCTLIILFWLNDMDLDIMTAVFWHSGVQALVNFVPLASQKHPSKLKSEVDKNTAYNYYHCFVKLLQFHFSYKEV